MRNAKSHHRSGPVGLTLALDLGQRGVRCFSSGATKLNQLSEDGALARPDDGDLPPGWGSRKKFATAGLPRSAPMDVFSQPRWPGPRLRACLPLRDEAKADIAAHNDGRPSNRIN